MLSAKPALQSEPITDVTQRLSPQHAKATVRGPRRLLTVETTAAPNIYTLPLPAPPRKDRPFQPRVPVITGEATYRGLLPVDGIICGQIGTTGGGLLIKQRPRNVSSAESVPELDGELAFKGVLRINGYVAGKVCSAKGMLIVDDSARVDAKIDVGVCVINGSVNGDVLATERVELGAGAVMCGTISTAAITMKPGAVFRGDCRMIKNENGEPH